MIKTSEKYLLPSLMRATQVRDDEDMPDRERICDAAELLMARVQDVVRKVKTERQAMKAEWTDRYGELYPVEPEYYFREVGGDYEDFLSRLLPLRHTLRRLRTQALHIWRAHYELSSWDTNCIEEFHCEKMWREWNSLNMSWI